MKLFRFISGFFDVPIWVRGVNIRWDADWGRGVRLRAAGKTNSPHFKLG